MHYRETILEAVSFAAEKFLTCAHWVESIQQVLARLGQAVATSRTYLFENHPDGLRLTSQRYEWVADGITPQIDNPQLQNFSYHPHFSRWVEILSKNQSIYGLVKVFPESEASNLADKNILSIAIVPIFVQEKWWGFIGYDDCLEEREWQPIIIETLKMAASLLGAAIAREHSEEKLRLAATVFEISAEGIIVTDANNDIIMANPAFTTITGYTLNEVIGKNPRILNSGHHNAQFFQNLWHSLIETGRWAGEILNLRKNGEIYVQWTSLTTILDSNNHIVQHVEVFSDITKRKEAEEIIWRQANFDVLTGLPNRILFADRLEQALLVAKRKQKQLAVMFIDLDRFKWVNDNLGHDVGDNVLKKTAERLIACIREYDTVARLGGDEFIVILDQMDNISNIKAIAQRILDNLSNPFRFANQTAIIGGSIGIAIFPNDGEDAQILLKRADMAMYQAKNGGRNNFCFFSG